MKSNPTNLTSRTLATAAVALSLCAATAFSGEAAAEPDDRLSEEQAAALRHAIFVEIADGERQQREAEMAARSIEIDGFTMRWLERTFGDPPESGRSLWLSLHGGGNAPAQLNDSQWRNQIRLYKPEEGIVIAPRAPTNDWNLWHQPHIDTLFTRLIENAIVVHGVNPDRVFLLGYSAGGDGVYQLAPRIPDRFAAAAMMAGHPNDADLISVRNLPFAILMGGDDSAFNRNTVAAEKSQRLKTLQQEDPQGYTYLSRIYPGLPHWMDGRDAEALPWMAGFSRNAWPDRVVWRHSRVPHQRFYWLQLPGNHTPEPGQTLIATVTGNQIHLEGDVPEGLQILLADELLDLDQPVEIIVNDAPHSVHQPRRCEEVIRQSLLNRLDPAITPVAKITVSRD